ncbi:hypothetical protein HUE58_01545 [Candidatus Ruthia endofausta]|uniref:DUF294 domain-containing protein n=1 Tax=Candidatus Ruthia endofausta TaxID=2738852 RepID=A0A6N0HQZ6_9GAMM|nr:hypothetical protein HUE58_01545 [Candidatus Ruthia endofausta]
MEAYKFINSVRIKTPGTSKIKEGRDVDNYALPEEISSLDIKHLKYVFHIVGQMQSAMVSQYKTALL